MAKGKFEKPRTTAAKKATSRSKKKKNRTKGMVAAVCAVVMAVALASFVGLYAYGSHLENSSTIFPNVWVAGVDVGGMTASEAQEVVEQSVEDAYSSQTLQVHLEDKTLEFDPQQTNVAIDSGAAIDKAMRHGKEDGPFQAAMNYLGGKAKRYDVELETALELDTAYIRSMITQAGVSGRREAKNSQVALGQDGQSITVTKGTPGRFLDEDALYEAVYAAFQSGNFEPLEWEYVEIPYVEAELGQYFDKMSGEVKDAYYDEEKHEIVEGTSGYRFDLEGQQKRLEEAEYGSTLEISVEEIEPEVTAEKLKEEMFGTQLDLRSSPYVNNANRTENLRLACEAINGKIINPGEVFSFNDTVGERTEAKGYKPATIFGGEGESTPGVGGGICQVASTIYWSALYMNLETVMREPHMYVVTYVPAGMDATIYWDSKLDYKFRNNRENPIMIKANTDGGYVNISFWGVKENDNYVVMTDPQTVETFTAEDVERLDETKPVGYREQVQTAYVGKKVVTHQQVYDGNGNLIVDRPLYSTYRSRPNIYVVGPSEPEVPEFPEFPENPDYPDWGGGDVTIPEDPWGGSGGFDPNYEPDWNTPPF